MMIMAHPVLLVVPIIVHRFTQFSGELFGRTPTQPSGSCVFCKVVGHPSGVAGQRKGDDAGSSSTPVLLVRWCAERPRWGNVGASVANEK